MYTSSLRGRVSRVFHEVWGMHQCIGEEFRLVGKGRIEDEPSISCDVPEFLGVTAAGCCNYY